MPIRFFFLLLLRILFSLFSPNKLCNVWQLHGKSNFPRCQQKSGWLKTGGANFQIMVMTLHKMCRSRFQSFSSSFIHSQTCCTVELCQALVQTQIFYTTEILIKKSCALKKTWTPFIILRKFMHFLNFFLLWSPEQLHIHPLLLVNMSSKWMNVCTVFDI